MITKPIYSIHCDFCNEVFVALRDDKRFCSKECRIEYNNQRPENPLTPSNYGTILELQVSIDLMNKGYEVFKSVGTNSKCDLIARRGNCYYAIEVRSGRNTYGNKIEYNKKATDDCDVYAVALTYPNLYLIYYDKLGNKLDL